MNWKSIGHDWEVIGRWFGRLVLYWTLGFATIWTHISLLFTRNGLYKNETFAIDSNRFHPGRNLEMTIGSCHGFGQDSVLWLHLKANLVVWVFSGFRTTCQNLLTTATSSFAFDGESMKYKWSVECLFRDLAKFLQFWHYATTSS